MTQDQREVLERLFEQYVPPPPNAWLGEDIPALEAHTVLVRQFRALLDIGTNEACLAAAMMCVPEGSDWSLNNWDGERRECSAWLHRRKSDDEIEACSGPTPALALASAIEQARRGDGIPRDQGVAASFQKGLTIVARSRRRKARSKDRG